MRNWDCSPTAHSLLCHCSVTTWRRRSESARSDGVFGKKLPDRPGYSSATSRNPDLLCHDHLLAILLAMLESPGAFEPDRGRP